MSSTRYRALALIVAFGLLFGNIVIVLAAGPYPTLDSAATARVVNDNATSTVAYHAADTQTAAAQPTATPTGGTGFTVAASAGTISAPFAAGSEAVIDNYRPDLPVGQSNTIFYDNYLRSSAFLP